ncbi:phytoene/squalene synthase family protein [Ensifer soli]|uniref:phytoene/squalene synthase family protein n=1 Tax=Ciceribacter sp. sgz301302 TaxID=3342379 RepID=UPI0035B73E32
MSDVVTAPPASAIYRPAALNYGFSGAGTDLDRCSASIRRGSKSFHIASLLLPRGTRQAAHALYAFCRHSDDAVDARGRRADVLERLRERLDRLYAGTPSDHACDRAFARLVETHAIPKAVPVALLDGFEMDMTERRYRTIAEVKDYAAGVAASVGIMMALVMDTSEPWALSRAADLGLAMQLTNIARDVGEDLANGRLYLPEDWLAEAGVDIAAFRAAPRFTPEIGAVVARLLSEADRHYALAHAGIAALPADCRHAIRTAALTYREIGREIAGAGYDSLSRRARTSLPRKLAIMLAARRPVALPEGLAAAARLAPPDPSVTALVAAAAGHSGARASAPPGGAGGLDRFATLLLDLERRARADRRPVRPAAGEGAQGGMAGHV